MDGSSLRSNELQRDDTRPRTAEVLQDKESIFSQVLSRQLIDFFRDIQSTLSMIQRVWEKRP